ncbi:MAG TPA: rRNA maturation RNase YbeY [Chitinophagales bacterium]
MPVHFFNSDVVFSLKKKDVLQKFILQQFKKESGFSLSLSCVFCSDEYLLKVNQDFLQHDYYTDIITFPLEQTKRKITAEIYISIDRVRENAEQHNVTFKEELHRVIFHGTLHLCGFGDKTESEQKTMRKKENEWLALFLH